MSKLKVMTILGTRPEIIRLSATIRTFDRYFHHILVHTGQNYDYQLNQVFFDQLKLREPDYHLNCVGETLGETMGQIIARSYDIIEQEKPDAVVILGDTNSSLSAISAKRLKCPIFHLEAGTRCWDWNVSEMVNRTIVDRIADINMAYTEHARLALLQEGYDPKTIFVVGSPMMEVLREQKEGIAHSDVLSHLALKAKEYILVSLHREENIDHEAHFMSLMEAVNAVAEKYQMPVICSTHPRTKKFIDQRKISFHPLIKTCEPFGFHEYCRLQQEAYFVLADSGTLSEESAILHFPAVLARTSTERPEALEIGSIVLGGIDQESILNAIEGVLSTWNNGKEWQLPPEYLTINFSKKVAQIIQSHAKTVAWMTWKKED